ncbi:MAG TPA: hypothetical protein VGH38_29765 [Bryobacteraceae bacterium]
MGQAGSLRRIVNPPLPLVALLLLISVWQAETGNPPQSPKFGRELIESKEATLFSANVTAFCGHLRLSRESV